MFDWDEGNIDKNLKHGVHDWEIEEACQYPRDEKRFILLGHAATSGKYLRVVYALRQAQSKAA